MIFMSNSKLTGTKQMVMGNYIIQKVKNDYTVDREIFVLKIFCALKFHGAKFS